MKNHKIKVDIKQKPRNKGLNDALLSRNSGKHKNKKDKSKIEQKLLKDEFNT